MNAGSLVFLARSSLARFVGCGSLERMIFTSSATHGLNLAIKGLIKAGEVVAVSSLEHNSVMRPLRAMEQSHGIKIVKFICDAEGNPDPQTLDVAFLAKPSWLIMTMASNVTGGILPFLEIIELAHKKGVKVGLDGSQYIGHAPFDFDNSRADFLAFPAHKGLLSLSGLGGLCLADEVNPEPLILGGTGSASDKETQPEILPDKYEAGTPNLVAMAALVAALDFINQMGVEQIEAKEAVLTQKLVEGLSSIPKLKVFAKNGAKRMPVVSFVADNLTCSELGEELDAEGIASRQGLHCAPSAHQTIGSFARGGTLRLSPSWFNSEDEIDEALELIKDIGT